MSIPPRDPALAGRRMLVTFDVDCGELIPGHHFVARGLSTAEIPHPDDLADLDRERLESIRGRGPGVHSVMVRIPDGGFTDDDESVEAQTWRRWRIRDQRIKAARKVAGFDFEYELVPGLTEHEIEDEGWFAFLVDVEYAADQPLPWDVSDGGAIAPALGGASTHGSRGSWPIPDGARTLNFSITGIDPQTHRSKEQPDGCLSVDLRQQTAHWAPRTS